MMRNLPRRRKGIPESQDPEYQNPKLGGMAGTSRCELRRGWEGKVRPYHEQPCESMAQIRCDPSRQRFSSLGVCKSWLWCLQNMHSFPSLLLALGGQRPY